VDGDFARRGTEHFAHAVVELQTHGGFVKPRGGGEPRILFVLV
jgi:hypothetical protein